MEVGGGGGGAEGRGGGGLGDTIHKCMSSHTANQMDF